jgi:hypothetical protein
MDFSIAVPKLFLYGGVGVGSSVSATSSPPVGMAWVITGIDAYPNVQPNNGSFDVLAQSDNNGTGQFTLYQVQQSQNFPGPFAWRGQVALFHGSFSLRASATVPFTFTVWGYETYNFLEDWAGAGD